MRTGAALTMGLLLCVGCGNGIGIGGEGFGGHQTRSAQWFQQAQQTAEQLVTKEFQGPNVDSLGAIVEVDCPQGNWLQAFGVADANGTPMTANMQFRAASITKIFTAMAVLELADSHKIKTADFISTYLGNPNPGGIPAADWNGITIEQLANHTSGLGQSSAAPSGSWTPQQILSSVSSFAAPGTQYLYANSNFVILGLLVQQVTSENPSAFFQQRFLAPLNLEATQVATSGTAPPLACQGYSEGQNVTTSDPSWASYAGNMVSNAQDLTRWIRAVCHGRLLTLPTQEILFAETGPSSDPTGFGVEEYQGWVGHTGRIAGYASACFYNPELDASVVVMVNRMDASDPNTTDPSKDVAREAFVMNDVVNTFFPLNPIGLKSAIPPAMRPPRR